MRSLRRLQTELIGACCAIGYLASASPSSAQFINNNGNIPSYYSSQNYSYGLNLPQVPMPNGQDEIRAADGTACRSNTASNNAYLDMGAIGSQGYGGEFDQGTFYGRVIVPLGDIPKRLDCSSLYNLEIQRLQHELALVRAGAGSIDSVAGGDTIGSPMKIAGPRAAPVGSAVAAKGRDKAWAEKGWSNSGWQGASKVGAGAALQPSSSEPARGPAPAPTRRSPDVSQPGATYQPMSAPMPDRIPGGMQTSASNTWLTTASITHADNDAPPIAEFLPWSAEPAIGPRFVTLMSGEAAADRARARRQSDVSVADITRGAMGGGY